MHRWKKTRALKYQRRSDRRKTVMDITSLTAVELGKKIKAKEISVVEAVKASIAQIEKVEKDVNSFVRILDKEGAAVARRRSTEIN